MPATTPVQRAQYRNLRARIEALHDRPDFAWPHPDLAATAALVLADQAVRPAALLALTRYLH